METVGYLGLSLPFFAVALLSGRRTALLLPATVWVLIDIAFRSLTVVGGGQAWASLDALEWLILVGILEAAVGLVVSAATANVGQVRRIGRTSWPAARR